MNCRSCRELIQQQLDGLDLDLSPEMEHHLTECTRCAALYEASLRLSDGLWLLASPSAPRGLNDRIVANVLADRRDRQRGRVRLAVFALAASLFICIAVAWQTFGSRPAENTPSLFLVAEGTTASSQDAMQPTTPEPASVNQSVTEAGNTLASLVKAPPLDELTVPTGLEPTISYFEAGQGFTVALEPVTNSRRRAFDLFRRDLPHVEPAQNP